MKMKNAIDTANRREFLRGGLRYALLAGLGAVTATVAARQQIRLPGQTCINAGICRDCTAFTDCGLPSALSAKLALKGDSP